MCSESEPQPYCTPNNVERERKDEQRVQYVHSGKPEFLGHTSAVACGVAWRGGALFFFILLLLPQLPQLPSSLASLLFALSHGVRWLFYPQFIYIN